jgi:FAM192A/Fyv6, N-terminal domain
MADDDVPVPSLTSGEIGSRFVSQTELDAANKKRDEVWKAAYERYRFVTLHLPHSTEDFTDSVKNRLRGKNLFTTGVLLQRYVVWASRIREHALMFVLQKLAANKAIPSSEIRRWVLFTFLQAAKQEEWEQKNKLSMAINFLLLHQCYWAWSTGNQFRALEPDEVLFLDSVSVAEQKKEQERKAADSEAIDEFKACVPSAPPTFTWRSTHAW